MPNGNPKVDVDVLVIGAGVTGLYQLHRAREAGFSTLLVEAGNGVGGTWYWNRYPLARFDSESYTYAYVFDRDLFDEWEWTELYAAQPEIERYFQHVAERFDLVPLIRFGTTVTSVVWHPDVGAWQVATTTTDGNDDDDDDTIVARNVVAATGMLSRPHFPDVAGREDFRGESHHTGRWPHEPVDIAGKRVAVVGTGSSGVQVIPAIAAEARQLTVYQRTPNWCTPLNNRAMTDEERQDLRDRYEWIRDTLNTSPTGFLAPPPTRTAHPTPEERRAFFEDVWNSPGFGKLLDNYKDVTYNPELNREWCDFIAEKIRAIVTDPETATKLIPTDHGYSEKRPPFVHGYFEVFNQPNVTLVSLLETPMVRVTETGIETTAGHEEFDVIVWATGFDYGTGQLTRLGVRGIDGLALEDHWADGPRTYLGIQTAGFPNFFFPGGPHGASANVPRYNSDQVDYVTDLLVAMRDQGYDIVDATPELEDEFTGMVDGLAKRALFNTSSYFFGGNIPGKPIKYLLNPGGRPTLFRYIDELKAGDYAALHRSKAPAPAEAPA